MDSSANGRAEHMVGAARPIATRIYPFGALVGQEDMKLALALNAISPGIGGVLIRGEKGSAKSTAVRGLAALLPDLAVVEGCAFGCDPNGAGGWCRACSERFAREGHLPSTRRRARLVELPLGATEDRVLGSLDLERAIQDGARVFEPGLLAAAHRGVLYIDEVNLLPDHLVDALLDAAASGVNVVEREGVSATHPAAFLLVGTMNPEEGDLRPQLLDRFGLSVEVTGPREPRERAEVIRRRLAFEADSAGFTQRWAARDADLAAMIVSARNLLPQVNVDDEMVGLIAYTCAALGVEGMRGDLTLYKAASALAALEGRAAVTETDISRVAPLALRHRRRRQPFEEPQLEPDEVEQAMRSYSPQRDEAAPGDATEEPRESAEPGTHDETTPTDGVDDTAPPSAGQSAPEAQVIAPEQAAAPPLPPLSRGARRAPAPKAHAMPFQTPRSGERQRARRGRSIGAAAPLGQPHGLALAATLRAAAPHQAHRRGLRPSDTPSRRVWLERWDLREPRRQAKRGALILFVVDASGSMAARRRMAAAKGAALALLQRAYQARDRVGLVQARGPEATLLLAPTRSTLLASRALTAAPTGGRTPLASALWLALRTFQREALRGRAEQPLLVVISDGRANVALSGASSTAASATAIADALQAARALCDAAVPALVIDSENGPARLGLAGDLATALGASIVALQTVESATPAQQTQLVLDRRDRTRGSQTSTPRKSVR